MKNDKTEKQNSQWRTLGTLIPYLWPKGENEIKLRVLLAIIALICAKVTNVYMPLLYKKAVDALTVTPTETLVLAVPTALLLAYGGARVMTVVFQELREALFAKVTQRAMRRVALETFQHLHALSMRFHITRQTGGLSRVIERGVKGIEF